MIKRMCGCALLWLASVGVMAGEGNPVKLGGRLFVDGGAFARSFHPSAVKVGITDVRLTGKVTLPQDWYTKVDVGFAGNRVSLKDAFVQKKAGANYFRVGYMLGMCCIEQSASTNDYVFMTAANAAETFYLGRRMGASYTCAQPDYYYSVGLFCGDGLNKDEKVRSGYNGTLRGVYRPLHTENQLLHVGGGALYRRPDREEGQVGRQVSYVSNGVTYLSVPAALEVAVDNVKSTFQWNVEALYLSERYFLQGEYIRMHVWREQKPSYRPWGAYFQGGWLLKGKNFGYDEVDALPLTPQERGSLLLSGRINVTQLNEGTIRGGVQRDCTLGLNYYLDKYLTLKFNTSWVWLTNKEAARTSFGVWQTRLQVRF